MVRSSKNIIPFLIAGMLGLNALPIMSAYCGGGESCMLMVRGFNLVEFSVWGILPISTVMLVLAILFSFQSKAAKNAELLLLLAVNLVCYAQSFKAARMWFESIGASPIVCHFGTLLFPLGSSALIIFAMIFYNRFWE
jgi:hypothetical protein